jgi:hypothetical protein
MAWCRDSSKVTEVASATAFEGTFGPGQTVPISGIYDCQGCKREVTSNAGDPFPPQNHHQHPNISTPVLWRLLVQTNTVGI